MTQEKKIDPIAEIKAKINYETYYKTHCPEFKLTSVDKALSLCPFHNDKQKSFSINLKSGLCNCFAGCGGFDVISFHMRYYSISFQAAIKFFCEDLGISIPERFAGLDWSIAEQMHEVLLSRPGDLDFLIVKKGVERSSILKFKIGWDEKQNRYSIPIPDLYGGLYNIILYDAKKDASYKFIPLVAEKSITLFPLPEIKTCGEEVWIAEGPLKAILFMQWGKACFSVAGAGASSWATSWNDWFENKRVHICYDTDSAGEAGAILVARNLRPWAKEIKIIKLPDLQNFKGGDITNWMVDLGRGPQDLVSLVVNTSPWRDDSEKQIKESPIYEVELSEAGNEKYYMKRVRCRILVAGKDLTPFLIPQKVRFFCDKTWSPTKTCPHCPLGRTRAGQMEREFSTSENHILKMVGMSEATVFAALKEISEIPFQCPKVDYEVLKAINIQELRVIPEVTTYDFEKKYVSREVFLLGENAETNKVYCAEGTVMPNPHNQYATILLYKMEPVEHSIDRFALNEDAQKMLEELFSIKEK